MNNLHRVRHRKKLFLITVMCAAAFLFLFFRLVFIMVWRGEYYALKARDLHERERSIKGARGRILDRNGVVLADNKTVCSVSVVHNQIEDAEAVIEMLTRELGLSEETVRKKVEKYSSMERMMSNVEKSIGDRIRTCNLAGVKVDEDYKRYYPYGNLAGKVLGFTGGDNQGILGLEVEYEDYLKGKPGWILTTTDAQGVEVEKEGERRIESTPGMDLQISLDRNVQSYAMQLAGQAYRSKDAEKVLILVMNPQNGEIYACVDYPEYDINDPFRLQGEEETLAGKARQDALNRMWRNGCFHDTYEPGSTFKIITAAAGLEEGVVSKESTFYCPGYILVDDRRIRCHKTSGHGSETFVQGTMNSCNPVFISVGLSLGVERYYHYFEQFGLLQKTGIDLPGEARTIMHRMEDMGNVELATVAFGQSFQITPIQLLCTVSSLINGGRRVTPHFGVKVSGKKGGGETEFVYPVTEGILSEETSENLREILELVVAQGSGKNGAVEGFRIGGKTATSQTLPRGSGKYISSFLGFAPADDPQVIAMAIVHNPKGIYYGSQVAAPIIRQLFENILSYLGIKEYNQ